MVNAAEEHQGEDDDEDSEPACGGRRADIDARRAWRS